MIDSVALTWGHEGSVSLDWDRVVERLGTERGQVRSLRFGDRVKEYAAWKIGDVVVMPGRQSGRVELRASLPKVLTGQNDVVLSAGGVHDALRQVAALGSEVLEVELALEDARPTRLDYVFHWDVPSVAAILKEVKAAYNPPRKPVTEWVSSGGALGRSLYYGMGGRHVLRFYDKNAESIAQRLLEVTHGLSAVEMEMLGMLDPIARDLEIKKARRDAREELLKSADVDKLLRFEVQDRRPARIREIHADGYIASAVAAELAHPLAGLAEITIGSVQDLIDQEPEWPHAYAYAIAKWAHAEHPELWPIARANLGRNTYSRWRKRARASAERTWAPVVPDDAFGEDVSAWGTPAEQRAAA